MSRRAFDAEIALDLAVNLIPLSIIVFFVAVFAAFNPWGFDPLQSAIQFAVLLSTALALAVVTFLAARVIETDDRTREDALET
jgi:Cu/Ag efflux pump CusA